MESTLIKFADDAKGGPADALKGQAAFCSLGEVEIRGRKRPCEIQLRQRLSPKTRALQQWHSGAGGARKQFCGDGPGPCWAAS